MYMTRVPKCQILQFSHSLLTCAVLQTLKEQVLGLELVPPVRADDEDEVVEDVAQAAEDEERLAAVAVRPRAGEERVHHGGQGLQGGNSVGTIFGSSLKGCEITLKALALDGLQNKLWLQYLTTLVL